MTLPGAAHSSSEYSPVALILSESFLLAVVVPCALPPALTSMPQPPTQVAAPESVRFSAGSTPLVSNTVEPEPVLNS